MAEITNEQNWDIAITTVWRATSPWNIKAEWIFAYMMLWKGYDKTKAGEAAFLYEIAMGYHYGSMN